MTDNNDLLGYLREALYTSCQNAKHYIEIEQQGLALQWLRHGRFCLRAYEEALLIKRGGPTEGGGEWCDNDQEWKAMKRELIKIVREIKRKSPYLYEYKTNSGDETITLCDGGRLDGHLPKKS